LGFAAAVLKALLNPFHQTRLEHYMLFQIFDVLYRLLYAWDANGDDRS
jgi:hypothetical protein